MTEPDYYELTDEEIRALLREREILESTIQRMVDKHMQELLGEVVKFTMGNDGKDEKEKTIKQKTRAAVEKFFEDQGIFRTR